MTLISASRRTDIPAFFGPWLLGRLQAGSCRVRNPFRADQVREVDLSPAAVDGLVLWTRRPSPFLPLIDRMDNLGYASYFQMTLTGLGPPLETGLPGEAELCAQFQALSRIIGPERLVWRFDPLLITTLTPMTEIISRFSRLADKLAGYCRPKVVTSLISLYAKTRRRLAGLSGLDVRDFEAQPNLARDLLAELNLRAKAHDMRLAVCCPQVELTGLDLAAAKCIDPAIFNQVYGLNLASGRDRGQRPGCNCAPAVDIGAYNSCGHGCLYCYATAGEASARANRLRHLPSHPELLPPRPKSAVAGAAR